jgi:hypothetical protein
VIILRALAGVLIGVVYGLLVGVIVYPLTHIGLDYEHPGPLIMVDPISMAWFTTVMSALCTGFCAAVLGLIIGLTGVRKTKAATIGFFSGLIVFFSLFILSLLMGSPLMPSSSREWLSMLFTLAVLPLGLALVGWLVSNVTGLLKSLDV